MKDEGSFKYLKKKESQPPYKNRLNPLCEEITKSVTKLYSLFALTQSNAIIIR